MFFKKSLPKLVKQFKPSIAIVGFSIARQGQMTIGLRGTAFCIAPSLLATAAHVYQKMSEEEKNNIKVWVLDPANHDHSNYIMFNAQFISQDQQNDIMLIKILEPSHRNNADKKIVLKPLSISDSDKAVEGEGAFFCGFPESTMSLSSERREISFVTAHSIISSVKKNTDTGRVSILLLDTNCDKGFSGSPVFLSRNGRIVGIISGRFESRESRIPTGLGLARPINPLKVLLKNYSP